LKREAATRFSFLLAIPAILLAAGYSILQMLTGHSEMIYSWPALGIAFGSALVSGILAIAFMMRFVKNHRLDIFAYYRIIFGLALFALYFFYGGALR
jgi:undecaprenyl-diphosphatase